MVPRVTLLCLLPLLASACAHEPMEYIPPADRSMLQAQARLGGDESAAPKEGIPVDEMLARARTQNSDAAAAGRLVLHFAAGDAAPDAGQKVQIAAFARATGGAPLRVIARKRSLSEDTALLTQRRAVAVAKMLAASTPNVDITFAVTTPGDEIIITRSNALQDATP